MKTFEQFVDARRHVDCLQTEFSDLVFEPNTPGYVYPDGLYIADGENPIELCREYFSGEPEYLQAVLYAFYLANSDTSEWQNPQLHSFIVSLIDTGGYDRFARALLANNDGGSICHHQDYCDANQLALDATGMADDENNLDAIIDAGAALYDDAAPYIRSDAQ